MAIGLLLAALAGCDDGEVAPVTVPELELLSAEQQEARYKMRQAERLIDAGAEASAEPLLRESLALHGEELRTYLLLGHVLVELGKLRDAVEILRRARELAPQDEWACELLAQSLHALGKLEEAEAVYRDWLAIEERADAHYGMGRVLYLRGEYQKAVGAFRRAEALEQARADIRSELGLALLALGRPKRAEAKQRDAIEREPGNAVAWFRLGDAIAAQGDARRFEAIDAMRRAVELKPRLVHAQLYLYRLLQQEVDAGNGDVRAEADRRWNTVLRLHRPVQLAGSGLGKHERLDPVEAAQGDEQALRAAVAAAPSEAAPRLRFALWLHLRGRFSDALAEYSAARAADPKDALAAACAGAAWLMQGRPERAEPLLALAVEGDPGLDFAWRDLAWARLQLDRADDALAAYRKLLGHAPDDARAAKGLGLAMMRAGELDEGLQQVARAGWLD